RNAFVDAASTPYRSHASASRAHRRERDLERRPVFAPTSCVDARNAFTFAYTHGAFPTPAPTRNATTSNFFVGLPTVRHSHEIGANSAHVGGSSPPSDAQ